MLFSLCWTDISFWKLTHSVSSSQQSSLVQCSALLFSPLLFSWLTNHSYFFKGSLYEPFVCSLPSHLCLVITKISRSMLEKKKLNSVAI